MPNRRVELVWLLQPISLIALIVLCCCCCTSSAHGSSDVLHHGGGLIGATTLPFQLPNATSLLELLATQPSGSPRATQPTLVLFTDQSAEGTQSAAAADTEALRPKVRQLAVDIPSSVLRVHEYNVPASVTERRLIDVMLNGVASRLPALVLFHGDPRKAQVVPGSYLANVPLTPPLAYPKPDHLRSISYMELRLWVLSEMPARYVDPITFHLIPSLQFVFHPEEVRETLRLVSRAMTDDDDDGGRSALPAAVSMAYVRLTTHGSEEVVAALSSLATQAGNAVMAFVTESPEVAVTWGLTQEHTIAIAPWAAVKSAYLSNESVSSSVEKISVKNLTDPLPIGTIEEAATATAGSASWRLAAAQTSSALTTQLRKWGRDIDSFNTTSPLRKLDSAAHLLHELVSLQQAIKVVFVLRESDEMWFRHHLDVAVKLASRMLQTSVLYNSTTLQKNAKVPSRVVRAWTPAVRMEVFWIDAEQLPDVADGFYVAQVPSVLVLAPLQSRFQDVSAGEGEEEAASLEAGLRSRDPFIGVHTVNQYDLLTAAFTNDASVAVDPPTGKNALPLFPTDSDVLVRFLASESFLGAVQYALRATRLSQLKTSFLTNTKKERDNDGASSAFVFSSLPNHRYARLDYRYYPLRSAEEPMEGPAYVRLILNGASPLPVLADEERQQAAFVKSHARGNNNTAQTATAASKAAVLQKKAAWEAELAKRRREREARVQRKAAEDAAAREKEKAAFQKSVEAAFLAEAEEERKAKSPGGSSAAAAAAYRTAGGLLVRRPSREAGLAEVFATQTTSSGVGVEQEDAEDAAQRLRRHRRYTEYQAWQADRARMVDSCVSFVTGKGLSLRFKWS